MVKYIKEENRFVETKGEISHWKKVLFLGTAFFIFFFWFLPNGLKLLVSQLMNNEKITNESTQIIADGMNGIVDMVVNFAYYGLKIFAVVLIITALAGAIRSYFRNK